MRKLIAIVAFGVCLAGCLTGQEEARDTLDKAGYTNIKINDLNDFWGCGEGDKFGRGFAATNPIGQRVSGVVCCGSWGKSCTIRF